MEADPWAFIKKYRYPLIIIGVGILVYFNMLFNGFVWDDWGYIILNPEIHALNLFALFGSNMFNGFGYFRPIPATYFAFLFSLFQQQSFAYHFIQLSIHIVNTLLLFAFLRQFFKKSVSFVMSLIFLVHPMAVESVSYIASADNPLFFFFGITTLLILEKKHWSIKRVLIIVLLFLLTLLTKEAGIMFLFFGVFYSYFFNTENVKKTLITFGGSIILYASIRFSLIGVKFLPINVIPIAALPLTQRIYSIPLIIFFYIRTYLFPLPLAIDQQWVVRALTARNFYLPLFADIVFASFLFLVGFYIWKQKKEAERKTFIFFLLWFCIGLGMYLQLFPLDMTVADRWFYAPSVGVLGIGGVIFSQLQKQTSRSFQKIVVVFICIIISIFAIRTMVRNTNWTDELTLYSHDERQTESFDLEGNLATDLDKNGNYKEALIHGKKSVKLNPYEVSLNNLGTIYEHMENFTSAKQYFLASLQAPTNNLSGKKHLLTTYIAVGIYLTERDNPENAVELLRSALQEYPTSPDLWLYFALAEYRLKNSAVAQDAIGKAYFLAPTPSIIYAKHQIENGLPVTLVHQYGSQKPVVIE